MNEMTSMLVVEIALLLAILSCVIRPKKSIRILVATGYNFNRNKLGLLEGFMVAIVRFWSIFSLSDLCLRSIIDYADAGPILSWLPDFFYMTYFASNNPDLTVNYDLIILSWCSFILSSVAVIVTSYLNYFDLFMYTSREVHNEVSEE